MKCDYIDLQPLYTTITDYYSNTQGPPPLPERDSPAYIAYRRRYKLIIKSVPQVNGVYLWYSRAQSNHAEYIYVGESHGNKKGLRGRLDDEFRRMYHGFWATVFKTDNYLDEAIQVFGNREKYSPKKSYAEDIHNDFGRRGATHIAYCYDIPSNQNIIALQNDLIQLYNNPRGNIKDLRKRPVPLTQISSLALLIQQEFDKRINSL